MCLKISCRVHVCTPRVPRISITPRKTNMTLENPHIQQEIPFKWWIIHRHVSFRGATQASQSTWLEKKLVHHWVDDAKKQNPIPKFQSREWSLEKRWCSNPLVELSCRQWSKPVGDILCNDNPQVIQVVIFWFPSWRSRFAFERVT